MLSVSNKVKVLLKMLTKDEEEMRDKWVNHQATVIKVEDNSDCYLMHSNIRATDVSTQWFLATCVHKAPQAFGYSTPRHGSLPHCRTIIMVQAAMPLATAHQGMAACTMMIVLQ